MQGPCLRIDCDCVGKELEDGVVIVRVPEGRVGLEVVWMCLH